MTCTRGRENRAAKEVLDLFNEVNTVPSRTIGAGS